MSRLPQIAILLGTLSAVGCTPVRPVTETNKAPDYTSQPRSLVFVPEMAGSLPDDQMKLFDSEFVASLRACGVKVAALPPFPVSDPSAVAAAIRNAGEGANADSALVVQTVETKSGGGEPIAAGYALTLDDLVSKKPVWKAVVNVHWDPLLSEHNALGRNLAAAIVASMRKDILLPENCSRAN